MRERQLSARFWRLALAGLLLSTPAAAWSEGATVVQRIGEPSGAVALAVGSEVTTVPSSPDIDASTTPILLAPGKAFVGRSGWVGGLRRAERWALLRAYRAGQTIVVPDASVHDVEALHTLLQEGVAHDSTTDPVMLAYVLRREDGVPTARVVTQVRPRSPEADARAFERAIEIVLDELSRVPGGTGDEVTDVPAPGQGECTWCDSPVQSTTLTSTTNGIYNTPIDVYALHSCAQNMDSYLVDTGGDWTPTEAHFESASEKAGQITITSDNDPNIDWQDGDDHCSAGIGVSEFGNDARACRYVDYPLHYEIDIVPPAAPVAVIQENAAPAGDQGQSTEYTSGFSFSIDGGVNVSQKGGVVGVVQAGVTWTNEVSTTVPPLVIHAGDKGNQGAFTEYLYCTSGTEVEDCTPKIQMDGQKGACVKLDVGQPQTGQTPNGRLSDVAQTVNWQVDPATYPADGTTFDVTVTWQAEFATSESWLWWLLFDQVVDPTYVQGYCNRYGCSCKIRTQTTTPQSIDHILQVPFPSTLCADSD
jgi:hypothetical protein